jgi:hypothetical protein
MIRTSLMTTKQFAKHIKTQPISGGKGDSTVNSTEKSQGAFTKTLQTAFASNNAAQQGQLNFLNQKLQSAINNPSGFSPEALAAMRTQATEQAAQSNKDITQAVQGKFATQGSATALPNGVQEQIDAGIAQNVAKAESDQQLGITEQNAQLQNQNKWKAVQAEQGVAGLENPTGMASTETGSAGEVGNLSQAATAANGPGVGSILGSVVGAGLQGWSSGGFKKPGGN